MAADRLIYHKTTLNLISLVKFPDVIFDGNTANVRIKALNKDEPIGGMNTDVFLRFTRLKKNKIKICLERPNMKISVQQEYHLSELYGKMTHSKEKMRADAINSLMDLFPEETDRKDFMLNRLKSALGKIFSAVNDKWEVLDTYQSQGQGQEEEPVGLPIADLGRKMPLKLPLFGFTEYERKRYLTEGFWAIPEGMDDPELYVMVFAQRPDEDGEYGGFGEVGAYQTTTDSFFYSTSFKFNQDIVPPPYTQEWLVSHRVLMNMADELSTDHGKELFTTLYNMIIPKHLYMDNDGARKTLAYWIMATYFYDIFDAFPIGHGWGFYGSGKSRLGMFVVALAYHGMFGIDITSADLFRTKEEFRPTLVIDENEENRKEFTTIKDDLINASYVRGAGSVSRRRKVKTERGEMYVRDSFQLYSPTFLCSINAMKTPQSRSRVIIFPMVKKNVKVPIAMRKDYVEIADALYEYKFKYWPEMREIYEDIRLEGLKGISARGLELWLPIFTVMKAIGRWEEDFDDVFEFHKLNENYQKEADMIDEERPTLYRAISKLYCEAVDAEDKGITPDDRWFRHPNNQPRKYEFEVGDLTLVMEQIAKVIGYSKQVSKEAVGRSLRMLGFTKSRRSKSRRATFVVDMNLFTMICVDHLGYTPEELGTRDYDSAESLVKRAWLKD